MRKREPMYSKVRDVETSKQERRIRELVVKHMRGVYVSRMVNGRLDRVPLTSLPREQQEQWIEQAVRDRLKMIERRQHEQE